MYSSQVGLLANHCRSPFQSPVDASQHYVELQQIDMLVFAYRSKRTCILNQGFTAFHKNTRGQRTCVNSYSDFVSINALITLSKIFLCQSGKIVPVCGGFCVSSSQSVTIEFARHLMSTLGSGGSSLLPLNCSLHHSSLIRKTSTWVSFICCSGFLHVSPNRWSCFPDICRAVYILINKYVIKIRLGSFVLCNLDIHNLSHC